MKKLVIIVMLLLSATFYGQSMFELRQNKALTVDRSGNIVKTTDADVTVRFNSPYHDVSLINNRTQEQINFEQTSEVIEGYLNDGTRYRTIRVRTENSQEDLGVMLLEDNTVIFESEGELLILSGE